MTSLIPQAKFRIVGTDHEDWDAYVCQHPKGSVFHATAMIRALAKTKGMEPFAWAAIDDEEKIVALLVGYHVKTLRQFASISSRAVQYAEPLCNPDSQGIAALAKLISLHDQHMRLRTLFSEVRSICTPSFEQQALLSCGYDHLDYINYVVDTTQDTEVLWGNVKKQMRQKIRSTISKGVVLRDDVSPEGIQHLYRLLQFSYGRARVPLLGMDLFSNVVNHLPSEWVRLRTAFLDDEPIASVISLVFGDRVYSWFGGTLRLSGLSPFACIVWDDIRWSSEQGYAHYDFGGAGWLNEDYGPRKFKREFGGNEVRYGRYLLTYSDLRLKIARFAYQVSQRLGVWS